MSETVPQVAEYEKATVKRQSRSTIARAFERKKTKREHDCGLCYPFTTK